jgi:AcrR family transcriptional regulator
LHNLREHILTAAYPLFLERGVGHVSEADICKAAHVSEAEMTSEFASTSAVAVACLVQHEREWTVTAAEKAARARGGTPETRLLALFDVLEEWFQSDEDEGRRFVGVLVDLGRDSRTGHADASHLGRVRAAIASLAREADLRDPDAFALTFHVLIKGCILSALEGDTVAGVRAREMGRELIAAHHREGVAAESDRVPGTTWFGDPAFDFDDFTGSGSPSNNVLDWYDIELGRDQPGD